MHNIRGDQSRKGTRLEDKVDKIAKPKDFENSLQDMIDEIIEDNDEKTKDGIKLETIEKRIDDQKLNTAQYPQK